MNLQVIGAGFGRTGTLSLKLALEQLGYGPCYHMMELFKHHRDHTQYWDAAQNDEPVDWDHLYEDYQSTVDWPSCNQWQTLSEIYLESKIIINLRDPESWYTSVINTIYESSTRPLGTPDEATIEFRKWIHRIIWDGVFRGRFEDKQFAITIYERHVENVLKNAPSDRLLTFDGEQTWEPLCEFLGCTVPVQPFPRSNSTEEFKAR